MAVHVIPHKLDVEKQKAFIESYDNLLNSLPDNEAVTSPPFATTHGPCFFTGSLTTKKWMPLPSTVRIAHNSFYPAGGRVQVFKDLL
jgi:hypothetical protein